MFYFIPAVWDTEEIHKTGTGNVETSKGNLKQLLISLIISVMRLALAEVITQVLRQHYHCISMLLCCT